MRLEASSCNPAWHKNSTMVQNYFSRSCYNASSNLQLQARLPGASQHHLRFGARSRAIAFCHSQSQTRIASHFKSTNVRAALTSGDSTTHIRRCSDPLSHPQSFCTFWSANRALAKARTFLRPHLPKMLPSPQFILTC